MLLLGVHGPTRRSLRRQRSQHPFYKGATRVVALASVEEILEAYPVTSGEVNNIKEGVKKHLLDFVNEFYDYLDSNKKYTSEEFIDGCKARHKDLKSLVEAIGTMDSFIDIYVVTRGSDPKVYDLSRVKYTPKQYSLTTLCDDEPVDLFVTTNKPKLYRHLHLAMIKVLAVLANYSDSRSSDFHQAKQLALAILTVGQIYQKFDPDPRVMHSYEDRTLDILTKQPEPISVQLYDERNRLSRKQIDSLFWEVVRDIDNNKLPYIRDFSNARERAWTFLHSSYEESDYYLAQTAAASTWPKFEYRQTLLHSAWETDPLDGCPFDSEVGYQSHYNKVLPEGAEMPWVVTLMIENPSKFKPRAIHIACNAIQDRCAYIHRRLAKFLSYLPEDCTKDQERGRRFLRLISNPSYREGRNWSSVLCMDWSNATDKLDQSFQNDVLRLFFPEPVVQLWDTISKADKVFKRRDGTQTVYKQITGQPQGLLGSFDAFAVAHHLIMLMTMKASGLEKAKYSDFARVLGDDSVISSVKRDPYNSVGDNYCQICAYANMEIERSKSTEVLSDKRTTLADFAKVTICDGEYYSPVPVNLALKSGDPNGSYYAISMLLWMHSKEIRVNQRLEQVLDRYYLDPLDRQVIATCIHGGFSNRFSKFEDEQLFDLGILYKVKLCYLISKVRVSFAQTLLGDRIRENLEATEFKIADAIENMMPKNPEQILDLIEDSEHKLLVELNRNLLLEDLVKDILGTNRCQTLLPSLRLTEQETQLLVDIIDATNFSSYQDPDESLECQQSIDSALKNIKSLERFNLRSVYKSDALEVIVFNNVIQTYKAIFTKSPDQVPVAM